MTVTHDFLSPAWISAARELREAYRSNRVAGAKPPKAPSLRLNLVVTAVPSDSESIDAHLDTTQGDIEIELGHLPKVDATVTIDFATAKTIFAEGNIGAAMEGLQLGRIKVKGNVFKLMSLSSLKSDPESIELTDAIRSITR